MKRLTLLLTALFLLTLTAGARGKKKRQEPKPLSTIEMIIKVNDYWQQHHKPQVRSFWDEAAYHTGNMEAYRLLEVARWKNYSEDWARHNKWMGAQGPITRSGSTRPMVRDMTSCSSATGRFVSRPISISTN
jgi:hypothetical protein